MEYSPQKGKVAAIPVQGKEEIIAINIKNLVVAGVADLEPICKSIMARWQVNILGCLSECETQSALFVGITGHEQATLANQTHSTIMRHRIPKQNIMS